MSKRLRKIISIACAVAVLSSLGLHTVQVEHVHYAQSEHVNTATHTHGNGQSEPSSGIESLGDKMHMAEKKFVYFALVLTLVFFALQQSQQLIFERIGLFSKLRVMLYKTRFVPSLFSFVTLFYSRGILNPKTY